MDAGAAVYAYDGDGRRMKKTVGTETTYYFYAVGVLVSEFSTSNTGATAAASTDRTTYQASDKLGTAVLLMAASGVVIENNRTLPYGEEWLPATGSANEQKFTSYQRDGESGLDYAIHRFDATTRGVFMSVDRGPITLALPQSLNRYIYAMADPVNYTDPSGLSRETPVPPPLRPIRWPSALEGTIESYIQIPSLNTAQAFLNNKVFKPDCDKTLSLFKDTLNLSGTLTISRLVSHLKQPGLVKDATKSQQPYYTLFVGQARTVMQASNLTISQFVARTTGTRGLAQLSGNSIYVNPNLITGNTQDMAAFLLHEGLHNLTGLTDSALMSQLGIPLFVRNQAGQLVRNPSAEISKRLKRDCF